jgi:hypothetical protein
MGRIFTQRIKLTGCGQVRFAEPVPTVLDDFHNDAVFRQGQVTDLSAALRSRGLNLDGWGLFALKGGQVRFAEPVPTALDDFHNGAIFR